MDGDPPDGPRGSRAGRPAPRRKRKPPPTVVDAEGNVQYRCEVCGRLFNKSYNLRAHSRLHTGERPFRCDVAGCGKTFRWKSSLTSHRVTHARGAGREPSGSASRGVDLRPSDPPGGSGGGRDPAAGTFPLRARLTPQQVQSILDSAWLGRRFPEPLADPSPQAAGGPTATPYLAWIGDLPPAHAPDDGQLFRSPPASHRGPSPPHAQPQPLRVPTASLQLQQQRVRDDQRQPNAPPRRQARQGRRSAPQRRHQPSPPCERNHSLGAAMLELEAIIQPSRLEPLSPRASLRDGAFVTDAASPAHSHRGAAPRQEIHPSPPVTGRPPPPEPALWTGAPKQEPRTGPSLATTVATGGARAPGREQRHAPEQALAHTGPQTSAGWRELAPSTRRVASPNRNAAEPARAAFAGIDIPAAVTLTAAEDQASVGSTQYSNPDALATSSGASTLVSTGAGALGRPRDGRPHAPPAALDAGGVTPAVRPPLAPASASHAARPAAGAAVSPRGDSAVGDPAVAEGGTEPPPSPPPLSTPGRSPDEPFSVEYFAWR
jgi:hypothetical protein